MKVLISPGYGAGWSTWNCKEMAIDEDLITAFENGCTGKEMEELCIKKGYRDPYVRGFGDLVVEEVPVGSLFKIVEYDGSESIEIFDPNDGSWILADR